MPPIFSAESYISSVSDIVQEKPSSPISSLSSQSSPMDMTFVAPWEDRFSSMKEGLSEIKSKREALNERL